MRGREDGEENEIGFLIFSTFIIYKKNKFSIKKEKRIFYTRHFQCIHVNMAHVERAANTKNENFISIFGKANIHVTLLPILLSKVYLHDSIPCIHFFFTPAHWISTLPFAILHNFSLPYFQHNSRLKEIEKQTHKETLTHKHLHFIFTFD